jgi:hypothetical protein
MPPFLVERCNLEDAAEIARSNISAFWNDAHWVLMWPNKTKEHVITQAIRRSPWNLLKEPIRHRHQKVIDDSTGAIVGYARWILPEDADATPNYWEEAKVARPSEQVLQQAEKESQEAEWATYQPVDEQDPPINAMKKKLLAGKKYIGMGRCILNCILTNDCST